MVDKDKFILGYLEFEVSVGHPNIHLPFSINVVKDKKSNLEIGDTIYRNRRGKNPTFRLSRHFILERIDLTNVLITYFSIFSNVYFYHNNASKRRHIR